MDDAALLAAFARDKSEAAFRELVSRHIGVVYSVCRRQLRDDHWAEDVTQAVFILLAKKAAQLSSQVVLGGWLYKTAVFACSNVRDLKRTRTYHENRVMPMMITADPDDPVERTELEGLMDAGLMELTQAQREVLVLRFFENKTLAEVAEIRGQTLYATQKALDSGMAALRRFLSHRGVTVSAAILAAVMVQQTAFAVPAALTASVSSAALGSAAAWSATVTQLVSEMGQHAARAKLVALLAGGAAAILLAGALVFSTGLFSGNAGGGVKAQGAVGGEVQLASAHAAEIEQLWDVLKRAEVALRTADARALSQVVAFYDPRQSETWERMFRVFEADYRLKQAAGRFGPEAKSLTAIQTLGNRLDEIIPQLDPSKFRWEFSPNRAALRYSYRARPFAGGSIYFTRVDGQWKMDAGESINIELEGVDADMKRMTLTSLSGADQMLVRNRMDLMESTLRRVTARIQEGQVQNLDQARSELMVAGSGPGRAFFSLSLKFDNGGNIRE